MNIGKTKNDTEKPVTYVQSPKIFFLCIKFEENWSINNPVMAIYWFLLFIVTAAILDSDFNKLQLDSSKDLPQQIWLQLAQWFWRRRSKFTDARTLYHAISSHGPMGQVS